ncbi:hypothetical protein Enr13x_07010 [Stieleria neptunia]|uniref:DUF1579 domain-containing protein n=1 Tax=Stieleria neptunia TaxID=2527979 RepID=A0A518HJ41_9BACT|nr:hypothetical protein [Stieleria neptunia]QDV40865.1 hypothetical protein Enr13x_07010 [Stieleria neptunia]
MSRRTALLLSSAFFLFTASMVHADETAEKWMKYFDGDWVRESKLWTTEEGWTEEKATWTGELAAGGLAHISRGKGIWGEFMTILAIEGHSGQFFEYGSAANGYRWRINFTEVSDDTLSGKLLGATGEGEISIKKTGKDSYEAKWEFKRKDGSEMKGTAKNTRK